MLLNKKNDALPYDIMNASISAGPRWEFETYNRLQNEIYLERYGYKVYSQNDEDGIIAEIFNRIDITNKKFIEFGVQDGLESNTHYLLFSGWTGLWIEGDCNSYNEILNKFQVPISQNHLQVLNSYVTKDNINELFLSSGYTGEIDLLSIDIDGNDYYVFKEFCTVNPRVLVIEYNGKFPPPCDWVMEYDESYIWDGTDKHGASLKALEKLGKSKGYQLVGTNIRGVNAFFVRTDLAANKFPLPATAENLYNPCRFYLEYQNGHPARKCIQDL
jgi:hypothetical protein